MLQSKTIPNLINGVSQQPPEVRLPSQCEEQINFYPSVVKGLTRRPGTEHIAKLLDGASAGASIHVINRDTFEKYIVVVANGDLRVFDLDGNEKTVNKPNGTNYLRAYDTRNSIRAITVADHTFIVNRERVARAYDPSAGLDLTPVTQRFQVLRFNTLSKERVDKFLNKLWEWGQCWGRYGVTIKGKSYTLSNESGGPSAFASYLAEKLSRDLNLPVTATGNEVNIPLKAGQALYSVKDISGIGSPVEACAVWGERPAGKGEYRPWCEKWVLACEITPENVLTVLDQVKTIGYASADGDLVPEAEVTNKEGLVHVRLGDYGTTYKVMVNGVTKATFTTSDTERTEVATTYIATQLYNDLAAAGLANITVSLNGNAILLRATNKTTDFTLTVDDSQGGKALVACKGRIQQFTDLPAVGFEGFTIKVAGQDGVEADDYYVQYSTESGGEKTSGSWKEVAKKGLRTRPAPNTMPHKLVSNGDGTFTFQQIVWDGRVAGDEESAPEPSFINKPISDVFFFKNRLGLLAEENVVFSESGSYYNFYPTTVLQSLETHPIDVAVTNDKVSILRHAVPFNETLLLFSDQTQFIVKTGDRLTKETINIDVTTRFEASLDAKPAGAGKNVFFAVNRGPFAGIREYYVDPEAKVNDAADVTGHCPTYLQGEVTYIAASSNEDLLAVTTRANPSALYLYKYYWQGNEKVQAAWCRWEFGGPVLGFNFLASDLLILIERGGKVYLERIALTEDLEEKARGFKTELHLDRLAYVQKGTVRPWTDALQVAVDVKGRVYRPEQVASLFGTDGKALQDLYVGTTFRSYFEFSPLIMSDAETRVAPLAGRLQLRFMTLNFVDSGQFTVGVQSANREPFTSTYSGARMGSYKFRLGDVPLESGRYRFPILGEASTTRIWIESSSHLPCAFLSAEWEGLYTRHSRRA